METVLRKVDAKERLPEKHGMYNVVISTDQLPHTSSFNERGWMLRNVTHWYEEIALSSIGGEEKTLDGENLLKDIDINNLLERAKWYVADQNGFDSWGALLQYYEEQADEIDPEEESTLENIIDDVSCKYGYDLAQIIAKLAVPSKKGEPNTEEDMRKEIHAEVWETAYNQGYYDGQNDLKGDAENF